MFCDFDVDVLFVGEHSLEPRFLLVGAQYLAGEQNPFDAVERVTGAAAMPECDLLNPLPAHGQLFRSQVHYVEGIHHRPCLR